MSEQPFTEIMTTSRDDVTNVSSAPSFGVMVIRATTMAIISFLAIFGNILVITAVLKYRKLRTSANVFVANLAIANLTIGFQLIFLTWNVVANRNALGMTGCRIWGYLTGTALICSTFTMALVACNRYVLIAHTSTYRRVFNPRKCVMMSVFAWLVGFLVLIGTVTGWSDIRFNERTLACSYARDASVGYHYFALFVGFAIPLVAVVVFYSLLYYTVWRSKKRVAVQNHAKEQSATSKGEEGATKSVEVLVESKEKAKKEQPKGTEVKLTKMLVTIFLVYVVCIGPYSLINMVDSDGSRFPEVIHVLVTWVGFSNMAINPIVYGFMNKNFRDGYVALLGSYCACARKYIDKARLDTGESTIVVKNTI